MKEPSALRGSDAWSYGTESPASSWAVLRNRNYALLFWGQLLSSTGTQVQVVAIAWQVFLLAHSAAAPGLLGLVEAIPRILCGRQVAAMHILKSVLYSVHIPII